MNCYLAIIGAATILSSASGADLTHAPLRASCINTHNWPKVMVPLDVRTGSPEPRASDFNLLEDGETDIKAENISQFRASQMGLALIVALDASGSMEGAPMASIQKGLADLVSRKHAQDRLAILSFADDSRWETRWGASEKDSQNALRTIQTRGRFTRLYDAVDEAMGEFKKQTAKDNSFPMRWSLLVISDGHDEGSRIKLPELLARLGQSRIRFDAIGLAHSPAWLGSLKQLSRVGFGELRSASSSQSLESLMSQGIESILNMPTIEFQAERLAADGKDHDIGIEYLPSRLRDELTETLPKPFYLAQSFLYSLLGSVLSLIACVICIQVARSRKQGLVPQPALMNTSAPPSVKPSMRAPRVAETDSRAISLAVPVGIETGAYSAAAASSLASRLARVPTELAPQPTSLSLNAVAGPYAGSRFNISEQEYWIGSQLNNHLVLEADGSVSGNHACIRKDQSFYRLYDNGSLNNTFVNGTPIGRNVTLIRPGDRLRVGESEFIVAGTR